MDPFSAAGLALGVASLGLQAYTGCIQGIQLVITAANFPDDCRYLNLRLRMEQQRLFAWSETSGLLDLDAEDRRKVLESNTFILHRTTVLDLLVQVQCLFSDFREMQRRNGRLKTDLMGNGSSGSEEADAPLEKPEKDAAAANVPLSGRRRDFVRKAMRSLRESSREAVLRLRWVNFDKQGFETLLARFAALNDAMTDILDARMQVEIHHTVQDTNRGVLQLHHRVADLGRLVMALNVKLDQAGGVGAPGIGAGKGAVGSVPIPLMMAAMNLSGSAAAHPSFPAPVPPPPYTSSPLTSAAAPQTANASGLQLLSQLAKFKAFNESIGFASSSTSSPETQPPAADSESPPSWDEATALCLDLGLPDSQMQDLRIDRSLIELEPDVDEDSDEPRCEAIMTVLPQGTKKKVWIEWKDYDRGRRGEATPPRDLILERVKTLAALLHHSPKPEAFRTPHCLGYFDKAAGSTADNGGDDDDDEEDARNLRLGLVFERPQREADHQASSNSGAESGDIKYDDSLPPVSLHELLLSCPKPRVTDRIRLAHAVANCLLYLHAVNWLHKGLRSHNVVFFRLAGPPPSATPPSSSDKNKDSHHHHHNNNIDWSRPYLSGFDFSRPARAGHMTDGPGRDDLEADLYRHPAVQSSAIIASYAPTTTTPADSSKKTSTSSTACTSTSRPHHFKKRFDIYSLGVLLVELAHWRPIDAVLGLASSSSSSSSRPSAGAALRVRRRLLGSEEVAAVGAAMGEVFEEAARRCIAGGTELGLGEGEDESVDDAVAARLSRGFYEDVVKRLGEVRV